MNAPFSLTDHKYDAGRDETAHI